MASPKNWFTYLCTVRLSNSIMEYADASLLLWTALYHLVHIFGLEVVKPTCVFYTQGKVYD